MADRLHASDVLNFPYLREIAKYIEHPRNWPEAIRVFAYGITTTPETHSQDRMLEDLLKNSTFLQSSVSNEGVIAALARSTGSNRALLRQFALQIGVRVKRVTN